MWMPATGYDQDQGDYYWVPGAWVEAPMTARSGRRLLGLVRWPLQVSSGYWGRHVGYYGGVNYGFGYEGIGFVGGEWRGNEFAYNTRS